MRAFRFALIVAMVIGTPMAMTGCAEPGTLPVPAPTRPASPAPEPMPTNGKINAGTGNDALDYFVSTVQKRMPKVAIDRRDEELEAVAEQSCALLASGTDATTIAAVARTLGTGNPAATTRAAARRLVRLSIATVCPAEKLRAAEF
jgi:Protein of unknown function (DUF732)